MALLIRSGLHRTGRRRAATRKIRNTPRTWWRRFLTAVLEAAKQSPRYRKKLDGREWLVGYMVPAVTLLGVLIWIEPTLTREFADLAVRVLSVLAAGTMLFAVIAQGGLNQLRVGIKSAEPPGPWVAWNRGPKQVKRCWQLSLVLVAGWLLAATAHLAATYVYLARDEQEPVTMSGFASEIVKAPELQMLAVETLLLIIVVMAVAIEEVLRKNNNAVVRVYVVALAYLALMVGSVAHIPQPLSVYGWLVGWHVAAFAAWAGLASLLNLARDADARFTRIAAQRFSQVAAVASVVVLVTGGALGTGWASENTSEVFTTLQGWALLLKVVIGLALSLGIGYAHRRISLPQLDEERKEGDIASTALLWRLGLIELIGMGLATTFGIIL